MAKLERILELLRTLIVSTADNTINISKSTIADIHVYKMHKNRLSFCSLNLSYRKRSYRSIDIILNLYFVRKILSTETGSHKLPKTNQINEVKVDSMTISRVDFHVNVNVQVPPPKPIIKPWEELVHNKHRTGLGYEKDVSFHM